MADTTNMNVTNEMETEMAKAEKTGVVDMNNKKTSSQNYTHEFSEEVEIEGKKYKKLTFYFDRLTGDDVEAVEVGLQSENKVVLSPEVSSPFQSAIAARAAGIGSDDIRRLPLCEYMKIKNKARDFLISAGF